MFAKITDPTDIFTEIISDYRGVFTTDLISIFLYGSAAGPDYRPGRSDINFMIVLTEEGSEYIDRALGVIKKWQRKRVAIPLFLTEQYIRTSTDIFPIEYINFQQRHTLVFGKDVFENMVFKKEHVRLQCEREIKGKLVLLQQAFLKTKGKSGRLKAVMCQSVTAFISIFRALLYLKDVKIPTKTEKVIQAVADTYNINPDLFKNLIMLKDGKLKLNAAETRDIFREYLRAVKNLAIQADQLGG